MSIRSTTLRRLCAERRAIDARIDNAIRSCWPIGGPIAWKRDGLLLTGIVVRHSFKEKILVRNGRTGRDVWIDGQDVLNAGPAN